MSTGVSTGNDSAQTGVKTRSDMCGLLRIAVPKPRPRYRLVVSSAVTTGLEARTREFTGRQQITFYGHEVSRLKIHLFLYRTIH
ncbi:unnamed protein product [Protopolystoma xenopodis]|uniref:Uncharacterized protein n=1 Tax=Protopolystoma xenopodis TaxID=117903 RepID=A0A3S5CQQ9_9PLAT|nr:unnamed protein product [Protopolystoma xenopodis]